MINLDEISGAFAHTPQENGSLAPFTDSSSGMFLLPLSSLSPTVFDGVSAFKIGKFLVSRSIRVNGP